MASEPEQPRQPFTTAGVIGLLRRGSWVSVPTGTIESLIEGGRVVELAMIVVGNLANLTLFSASIPGPEQYMAGHPLMVVTVVLVQIVATLALTGGLAAGTVRDSSMPVVPRRQAIARMR